MDNKPYTSKKPRLTEYLPRQNKKKNITIKPIEFSSITPQEIKSKNSFYLNIFLLVMFIIFFIFFAISCKKNSSIFQPNSLGTLDMSIFN